MNNCLVKSEDCIKCGAKCCKVFQIDLKKYKKYLKLDVMDRLDMLDDPDIYVNDTTLIINKPCINLTLKGRCSIYQNRPKLCKVYPQHKDKFCKYVRKRGVK